MSRLGAHHVSQSMGTEQDIGLSKIIVHNSYRRPSRYAHDIALLKLSRPAVLNKAINLACLPGSSGYVQVGKRCWVTGTDRFNTSLCIANLNINHMIDSRRSRSQPHASVFLF